MDTKTKARDAAHALSLIADRARTGREGSLPEWFKQPLNVIEKELEGLRKTVKSHEECEEHFLADQSEIARLRAALADKAAPRSASDLRAAGCALAQAALYTIGEYDGLHRLSIAVSRWAQAVADEGGRGSIQTVTDPKTGITLRAELAEKEAQ